MAAASRNHRHPPHTALLVLLAAEASVPVGQLDVQLRGKKRSGSSENLHIYHV